MLDPTCFLCGSLSDRGGFVQLDSSLRVTSDIAPIHTDHSLFYTNKHHRSFSELSSLELDSARGTILGFVEAMKVGSSPRVFLEHGPADGEVRSLGCCDHAHIHFVPLGIASEMQTAFDAQLEMEAKKCISADVMSPYKAINFNELHQVSGRNYLWFSRDLIDVHVFLIKEDSRQLLRRIVSAVMGRSGFETWRLYDRDAAALTMRSLRKAKKASHKSMSRE